MRLIMTKVKMQIKIIAIFVCVSKLFLEAS